MTNFKDFKYRNFWQHPAWERVQSVIGRKTYNLSAEGARALVVRHQLPFGLCWLEVPRGPLFEDHKSLKEILAKIKELGQKERAVFVRMSPYRKIRIQEYKLKLTKHDHHPETTLIIDLSKSEDEILKQMKQKGRYNIKVAEKHGVTVEASDNVDAFYELLSKTANRDGFHVHPKSYYEKMLEALGRYGQLLLATYQDRVVAGGLFVYLDEWGIYYYGASSYNYRNLMAPYLVQWTAIKEAKRRKCQFYDFLGISPEGMKNHAWAGVTSFKKKFGGEIFSYPRAQDMALRKFWYFMYRLRKFFSR